MTKKKGSPRGPVTSQPWRLVILLIPATRCGTSPTQNGIRRIILIVQTGGKEGTSIINAKREDNCTIDETVYPMLSKKCRGLKCNMHAVSMSTSALP